MLIRSQSSSKWETVSNCNTNDCVSDFPRLLSAIIQKFLIICKAFYISYLAIRRQNVIGILSSLSEICNSRLQWISHPPGVHRRRCPINFFLRIKNLAIKYFHLTLHKNYSMIHSVDFLLVYLWFVYFLKYSDYSFRF